MLLYRNLYILCSFLFLAAGCTGRDAKEQASGHPESPQVFSLPAVPGVLATPQERAEYLIARYWENFNFRDTALISRPEVTEQALADFLDLLPRVSPGTAHSSLVAMMDSASADSSMYVHFMGLAEKYLYNPNSPFRNEEYYIPVLRQIMASSRLGDIGKVRPAYQLEMALKNRPGEVASDFVYTRTNGSRGRLSRLSADYTLLFFNSPDCEECRRLKEYIAASELLSGLASRKRPRPRLVILAVYPDEDVALWKSASYPSCMLNVHDASQAVTARRLYDLRAIPTLYLLDADKRVLLKDAPVERVERYLRTALFESE